MLGRLGLKRLQSYVLAAGVHEHCKGQVIIAAIRANISELPPT
jgi:hypothetical protein